MSNDQSPTPPERRPRKPGPIALEETTPLVEAARGSAPVLETTTPLPATPVGRAFRPTDPTTQVPTPGTHVGRFVVLDKLGEGGIGLVFSAYDADLDRKVAIKLLRSEMSAEDSNASQGRERLVREARAMARLEHPNVVRVHEVGTWRDQVFVAMEFAGGGTLKSWLRAEPRAWRDILDKLVQAGRGLAAAHHAGLVHRDFKPENVLLGPDGQAHVADFGLVGAGDEAPAGKPARAIDPMRTSLTMTGTIMGTPSYMAPEQHRGERVGPAADQFAFCVTAWEALYGARPYVGASLDELRTAILDGKPPEIPIGEVPPRIHAAIRRGLEADPAKRWSSMDELLAVLAVDQGARRRRMIATAGAAAAAILVIAGAIALVGNERDDRCSGFEQHLAGVWDGARKQQLIAAFVRVAPGWARDSADHVARALDADSAAWIDARQRVCRASERGEQSERRLDLRMSCLDRRLAETRALVDVLATRTDAAVIARAGDAIGGLSPLSACDDLAALEAVIPPPADPRIALEVAAIRDQLATAKALELAGRYADAHRIAEQAGSRARGTEHAAIIAEALERLASTQAALGDPRAAVATLDDAVIAAARARDTTRAAWLWSRMVFVVGRAAGRPGDALILRRAAEAAVATANTPLIEASLASSVAAVLFTKGDYPAALDQAGRALAIREQVLGRGDLAVAESLNDVASIQRELGKLDAARASYQRVLEIRSERLGTQHPLVSAALNNLGNVVADQGRLDDARALYTRALTIRERVLGPDHPEVADTLNNIATVEQQSGAVAKARELYQRVLAIRTRALGAEHVDVAAARYNLGTSQRALGDPAARATLDAALAGFRRALGPDHPNVASALDALANLDLDAGNWTAARDGFSRSLAIREKALGPTHSQVGGALNNLGNAQLRLGERTAARASFVRALAIQEAALGSGHFEVALVVFNLAELDEIEGAREAARAKYQRALDAFVAALGANHPLLAHPLTGLAEVALATSDVKNALGFGERALALRETPGGVGEDLGRTRFVVAQALWTEGRDRPRARKLARAAREALQAGGPAAAPLLRRVDAWLSTIGG